jgi:NitT/TauT family transport system substrate-binding protein
MLRMSENFRALFYAPFYAAFAIGAYQAEGVAVELVASADPAGTTAELLAGKVDAMWGGPLRVMTTRAADPSVDQVCFCDVIVRDPFFVIGREPRPNFKLADLVGVRFASVSEVPTPWVCLQHDLRLAGIDPGALNRTSGLSMAQNAASLQAGRLDAAQMFQPYAETLIAEGAGHVWYAAATRGPAAYTTLSARRSVLEARRDEFAAMVRGMYRTLRWFGVTPAADIARALAEFLPDVPQPILAAAIERYRVLGLYTADPVMRRDGFDWLQSAMRASGMLQPQIPFEACVDNSLAEAAVGAT